MTLCATLAMPVQAAPTQAPRQEQDTRPLLASVTPSSINPVLASAAVAPILPLVNPPVDRAPRRGIGPIITGSVLTGVGLVPTILGIAFIARANQAIDSELEGDGEAVQDTAKTVSGAVGAIIMTPGIIMIGVGAPLIAVGAVRQSRYSKWKAEHQAQLMPRWQPPSAVKGASGADNGQFGFDFAMKF